MKTLYKKGNIVPNLNLSRKGKKDNTSGIMVVDKYWENYPFFNGSKNYNKLNEKYPKITKELIEIISGAESL